MRGWTIAALSTAMFATSACHNAIDTEKSATESVNPLVGETADERSDYAWPEDPKHPIVRIDVTGSAGPGIITVEVMPELAPVATAQFIEWIDSGFYDGTTFHRVMDGFMIQGGDPNTRDKNPANDGDGGAGFTLDDEFCDAPFMRGVVGLAKTSRPDSSGSQFFITQADSPILDGQYIVVGRVRSGMKVVDAIVDVETDRVGRWGPRDRPIENVVMSRVHRIPSEVAKAKP